MNKFQNLPMPRAPFSIAILECSEGKPKQPISSLKNKLMICLVMNLFAFGLLVGLSASTINQAVDTIDPDPSSVMKGPRPIPENGKPLMKPQILDESLWSRECNFNLQDMKLGRIPLNSKFFMLNENCTSFVPRKTLKN